MKVPIPTACQHDTPLSRPAGQQGVVWGSLKLSGSHPEKGEAPEMKPSLAASDLPCTNPCARELSHLEATTGGAIHSPSLKHRVPTSTAPSTVGGFGPPLSHITKDESFAGTSVPTGGANSITEPTPPAFQHLGAAGVRSPGFGSAARARASPGAATSPAPAAAGAAPAEQSPSASRGTCGPPRSEPAGQGTPASAGSLARPCRTPAVPSGDGQGEAAFKAGAQ